MSVGIGAMQSIGTFGCWVTETITCDYPSEDDVQEDVEYGNGWYIGNFVVPALADVEDGVFYGASGTEYEGTLEGAETDYPAEGDVQEGVVFANSVRTGTLGLPTAAQVLNGVGFGADDTEFTGNVVLPGVGDVEAAVTFGALSALIGTFGVPAEADVELGVQYGGAGTEFTGAYEAGDADYPSVSDVQSGVVYANGLYTGAFVVPAEADVEKDVEYGAVS